MPYIAGVTNNFGKYNFNGNKMYKKVNHQKPKKSHGTLKAILCFSGVVSLLALAVPSSFKLAVDEEEQYERMLEAEQLTANEGLAIAEEEAKAEAKVEKQLRQEQSSNTVIEDTLYDNFEFGEPSFNPNPVALDYLNPTNPSPQIENNLGSNGDADYDDEFYEE